MSPLAALGIGIAAAASVPATVTPEAALAQGCLGCHAGDAALSGRDPEALFDQLDAWRDADDAALMARIARGYTVGELRAIVEFLTAR